MREIKFRGLNAINEWVYGCLITNEYPTHEKCTQIYNNTGFNIVSKESIGQYTGLKDKKGVEVYEGDVLTSALGAAFGVVDFREGSFVLNQGQDAVGRDKFDWIRMVNHGCEIIGNIHQNPVGDKK